MMISVQDVEFKGNSLARYLQIFADNGVVVDMISQSAPHGTTIDFSFTASSSDLPLVMKAISVANLDKDAKASPLISVGYSKLNLFGEEMVTSCGVAARALNSLAMAGAHRLLRSQCVRLLLHRADHPAPGGGRGYGRDPDALCCQPGRPAAGQLRCGAGLGGRACVLSVYAQYIQ